MAVKRYNGTSWDTVAGLGAQGAAAQSSSITTWVKTASGGETSLTGSSDSSTTLAYTPGQEQVFINGVLQVRGSDYTATNGTSITGLTALVAGDIATVTTVNAFSVTGAVPLSTVTANGDLIVGTSAGAVGRLGVGSTGQVLSVSGGALAWATPTAGAYTQLATGSLTGSSVTISSISSSYRDLVLVINNLSLSNSDEFAIRINGKTSGYGMGVTRGGSAAGLFDTNGYSIIKVPSGNTLNSATNYRAVIEFPDYATSGPLFCNFTGVLNSTSTTSGIQPFGGYGSQTDSEVLSSITLMANYGGAYTFDNGTYTLYGVK